MLRVKSSRRPAGLKPTDYDHEIALVDHDAAATPTGSVTPEPHTMTRYSTTSRLLDLEEEHEEEHEEEQQENPDERNGGQRKPSSNTPNNAHTNEHVDSHTEGDSQTHSSSNRIENGQPPTPPQTRPSIEVQGQYGPP